MIRDIDLVRNLLLLIEARTECDGTELKRFSESDFVRLPNSAEQIRYHLELLMDAGLIAGHPFGPPFPLISKITWEGHEFLDTVRDHEIWEKTKERIQQVGGASFSIVSEIARREVKSRVGLS